MRSIALTARVRGMSVWHLLIHEGERERNRAEVVLNGEIAERADPRL